MAEWLKILIGALAASGITSNPASWGHQKSGQLNGRFGGAATIAAVWRRRKLINDSHSGGKALNPRGLGTESPTIKRFVFRTRTPRRMERLDGRWTGRF
jgi:hypothetical protein